MGFPSNATTSSSMRNGTLHSSYSFSPYPPGFVIFRDCNHRMVFVLCFPGRSLLIGMEGREEIPASHNRRRKQMSSNRGVVYVGPGKVEVRNIADPVMASPNGRKLDHAVIRPRAGAHAP